MGQKGSKEKGGKSARGSTSAPAGAKKPAVSSQSVKARKSLSVAVNKDEISASGAASRMVRQIVHVHENAATSPVRPVAGRRLC